MKIDYPKLVDDALRGFVRDLLASVAEDGLPGDHHFCLTFRTRSPGVKLPRSLLDAYPDEMTVVLQHQFWDLVVEEEAFEVTLRFGGTPHRLRVPYGALKTFVDPAAEFGLQFEAAAESVEETAGQNRADPTEPDQAEGGQIVSLEDFRKKDR